MKRRAPSGENNGERLGTSRRRKDITRGQPSSRERRDRQRATKFRCRQDTTRVTELIDAQGNREFTRQQGRMIRTKHTNVLSALEKRALRYRSRGQKQVDPDKVLYDEAIDETGTV